jgi:hypothetical protein
MNHSRKAPFTRSPLAFSHAPIHVLASTLQDFLHFPDPYPLYAVMAALVANIAAGRPVWLLLVGPPSCGKTELLSSLLGLPNVIPGGSITGPGALLSGSRKRERTASSTGGLLREIGLRGALVIKEFTSILSLPGDTLRQILAAFREVYDGQYTRSVGTDGGSDLHWAGKAAILTGSTEAIDHHHQLVADMGERFVFYRYESSDGWSEAYKALSVDDPEQLSPILQAHVSAFFNDLDLSWEDPPVLPELDPRDRQRIIAFSQFAARGRSAVIRDDYSHEVIQASSGEYPVRLALALSQLLRALRFIGVDDADSWRIVRKLAFDSLPGPRRLTLLALLSGQRHTPAIAAQVRVSQSTVRRALEELSIHSLVTKQAEATWEVSDWAKDRLSEALNGTGIQRE